MHYIAFNCITLRGLNKASQCPSSLQKNQCSKCPNFNLINIPNIVPRRLKLQRLNAYKLFVFLCLSCLAKRNHQVVIIMAIGNRNIPERLLLNLSIIVFKAFLFLKGFSIKACKCPSNRKGNCMLALILFASNSLGKILCKEY